MANYRLKWIVAKGMKYLFRPAALHCCRIDFRSRICPGCELTNVTVERYSYLGSNCFAVNAGIGCFCSIADRCRIGGAQHPMDRVSTSPVFHFGRNVMGKNFSQAALPDMPVTTLENDVWLGAGSLIKSGVTIHSGAVIGMGSVVTHDIGPYEIWAGNPARFIRKRFDDATIEKLLKIQWWNWEDQKIEKYAAFFDDPQCLFDKLEEDGQL